MTARINNSTGVRVTRAEWGVVGAIALNIATLAFGGGIYVNTIQQQGRDIDTLKLAVAASSRDYNDLKVSVARIDANVTFLTERAREDREYRIRQ